jgi:chromosome segregation ATPase
MLLKRVVALLALAAGFLGFVACITGTYPISLLKTRLDRTNERVFATIDKGLASAQDRVREVQGRVRESKIRTSEIAPKLRDWRASKAKERLASAVEVKSRVETIIGRLQTADQLLQKSMDSIGGIRQAFQWLVLIGVPADSISPEKVLEELTSTQDKLRDIEKSINGVGEFTVNRVGESEDNRLSRVFELLSKTELTAGAIDTRLEDSANRVSQMQADAQQLKARISHYILFTTIGGYLVFAWLAAGQAALCLFGWKNCSRSKSSA